MSEVIRCPTKAPKPWEDPSTSSFRKGFLQMEHPKMLAAPLSIQKGFQSSWASQNACSSLECFWKISGQRLQEFQCKVEIMCERNVALGKSCSPPVLRPAACLEPNRAQPGWALSSACSTRSNENTWACSPGCLGTSPKVPFAGLMQKWLLEQNLALIKMRKFQSNKWELGKKWCHSATPGVKPAGSKPIHCIWCHRNAFFPPQY